MAEMTLHSRWPHPTGGRSELLLVRHGRTHANVERRLMGNTDIPLDDLGVQQAALVADRIAAGFAVDRIVTSPLQRARVTAAAIADRVGIDPIVHDGLREMHFGEIEGYLYDTLMETHPELATRALDPLDDDLHWPGGEQRRAFNLRVGLAMRDIAATWPGERVVVVAHLGVIGSFLAQVEGHPPSDWRRYQLANTSLTHLEITPEGTVIHLLNDQSHLEDLS